MTQTFNKFGIQLTYPETWTLEEQQLAEGAAVTVASPQGAFWTVAIHPGSVDPDRAAAAVLAGIREEYEDAEFTEVVESAAGHACVGYEAHFTCLDLTNTAQIRAVQAETATYTILYQAEDREYDDLREVFRAITASMLGR